MSDDSRRRMFRVIPTSSDTMLSFVLIDTEEKCAVLVDRDGNKQRRSIIDFKITSTPSKLCHVSIRMDPEGVSFIALEIAVTGEVVDVQVVSTGINLGAKGIR